MTFCAPLPGLVGSQFLYESQMQWSATYTSAKACHARTPTKVYEVFPNASSSGTPPGAKRPRRVTRYQIFVLWYPAPNMVSCVKNVPVSKSLEELAREVCEYKTSPMAERKAAKLATKADHCLCRSPHG